ncbi:MAG: ubiquinol-cytochrome c reductase iron-sulfur subunit [Gammaproteobacteria bacterium]|jgi:ubiquinol-cytochrome c reductase iron-sulfur subunit
MSYSGVGSTRRRFLTGAVSVVGAVGVGFTAVPFVLSWQPSERAKALGAPVEVDIGKLEPGVMITTEWRGKPVWVVRRTEAALAGLEKVVDELRDPSSSESDQPVYAENDNRALKSEFLVLIGVCTHLGCAPTYVQAGGGGQFNQSDDWMGFFCPCHGSKFDLAGRVYKGVPANANLAVPPHRYLSDSLIEIGVDTEEGANS